MRLFITTLSLLSVIGFGYALAGYGGTMLGYELRADYVTLGLLSGFICAGVALILWYRHRRDFFDYSEEDSQNDSHVS